MTGRSASTPVAAFEDPARRLYGVQFHPEVVHTPYGQDVLKNFLYGIADAPPAWTPAAVIEEQVERIRAQVGSERVICGLSGGVDSAVAALLVYKAVGDQLTCVFVDHGFMRSNEAEQVAETFGGHFQVPLVHVQAQERFLARLEGVDEPEEKRHRIGEEFIRVFEEEAGKLGDIRFLVQGTLYSDVIESGGTDGVAAKIKSHHNVGGLPEDMAMDLVEPLRLLFKDEVRRVGEELGMPERMVWRQPFPGPGLAIRIIGEVTRERLDILRAADTILQEEVRRAGLYRDLVAELRRAAGDQVRRRPGRRAHLRLSDRDPRRHVRGRDDRRLGAASVRPARDDLQPDHQRDPRRQPCRPRHQLEAAVDDRVGMSATLAALVARILLIGLLACAVFVSPAAATEFLGDRDVSFLSLKVNARGEALVSYRNASGVRRDVLIWGAVNAHAPDPGRPQVKFRFDYTRRHANARLRVRPLVPEPVPARTTAPGSSCSSPAARRPTAPTGRCNAGSGSRRCAASTRSSPSRRPSSSTSRTGRARCPVLEVSPNWTYGASLQGLFGRLTYRDEAVYGFRTPSATRRDPYARFVYIDTFNSVYGPGWKRDTAIVTHQRNGAFCYSFVAQVPPPGYPSREPRGPGNGERHRVTVMGPGVTPIVQWEGEGLHRYDRARTRCSTGSSTGWSARKTRSAPASAELQRVSNPVNPSGSSCSTSTQSTRAPRGPSRMKPTIASTASCSPSITASTLPSGLFATQPATPRAWARRRVVSRKKTPWT